jgi:hypothetical protein
MEDLCASLSSSHVGQEAMDLAALQVSAHRSFDTKSRSDCLSGPTGTDVVLPVNDFFGGIPAPG